MKKQSHTVPRRRQSASPASRHLPLVGHRPSCRSWSSPGRVLEAAHRAAVCGPRYAHQPRHAYRAGHAPSQVVLGGHKVAIRRPRVRRDGMEVPLPTAQAFTDADPLNRRVVDQMLIGVATRQYARSRTAHRGAPARVRSVDALWRRPRAADAWRRHRSTRWTWRCCDRWGPGRRALYRGGASTQRGPNTRSASGKEPRRMRCQGRTCDRAAHRPGLLVIVDGAKALETAVTQTFGRAAVVQRCQVHKGRNILEHLPEAQRPQSLPAPTRRHRQDGETTAAGPGSPLGHRPPECGRERPRRPRRDADRARLGPVGTPPTIARHHERHRESAQPHAPCEAQCETLARWDDGAAVGGRRRARSREGVPPGQRMSRYAGARRRPPGA